MHLFCSSSHWNSQRMQLYAKIVSQQPTIWKAQIRCTILILLLHEMSNKWNICVRHHQTLGDSYIPSYSNCIFCRMSQSNGGWRTHARRCAAHPMCASDGINHGRSRCKVTEPSLKTQTCTLMAPPQMALDDATFECGSGSWSWCTSKSQPMSVTSKQVHLFPRMGALVMKHAGKP